MPQTRTGFSFAGYWSGINGTGIQYYDAQMRSVNNWDDITHTILHAHWVGLPFTVTLRHGNGTANTTITATFGSVLPTANLPIPTRVGYRFDGYFFGDTQYLTPNYGRTAWQSSRVWNRTNHTTILDARWTPNRYTVTLNRQNGSGGLTSVTVTFGVARSAEFRNASGVIVNASNAIPHREGFIFLGYWTQANSGGDQYFDRDMHMVKDWDNANRANNNQTLHARWRAIEHLTLALSASGYTIGPSFRTWTIYVTNPNPVNLTFRHFTQTSYNGDARNIENNCSHRATRQINADQTISIHVTVQLAGVRYFSVWFDFVDGGNNHRYITVGGRINLHSSDWRTSENITRNVTPEPCVDGCGDDSCIIEGTLITLADGSRVPVEDLVGGESILVWNFYTGQFDVAPIFFIATGERMRREIYHLQFGNGSYIKMVYQHAFFNITLNRFVDITRSNALDFVGHYFKQQSIDSDGNLTWEAVRLENVDFYFDTVRVFAPVTARHFVKYANGFLAAPSDHEAFLNVFEVLSDTLSFCQENRNALIAQFGLLSFDEFSAIVPIVPEFFFNAYRGEYIGLLIASGAMTWDCLFGLLEKYADLLSGVF